MPETDLPKSPGGYMRPAEVSELIQVCERTLSQWRYRNEGPPFLKFGGHVRYARTKVDAWIESCGKQ